MWCLVIPLIILALAGLIWLVMDLPDGAYGDEL